MIQSPTEPAFPHDLGKWQAWQNRRRRASRAMGAVREATRRNAPPTHLVLTGPGSPDVLVAFDSVNPPTVRTFTAIIAALRHHGATVAVVDAGDVRLRSAVSGPSVEVTASSLRASRILAIGNFAKVGHAGWVSNRRHGGKYFVLQHGLLTPFAPPLAVGSHLLAWNQQDGEFWAANRADVTFTAVGSAPLSWARAEAPSPRPTTASPMGPLFLGQMHGAELDWSTKVRSAHDFCTVNQAEYRPHPAETSLMSRTARAALRAAGVTIEPSDQPLSSLRRPIVSMFSTGLLEAAAAGLKTYGTAHNPPPWLDGFWSRYRIGTWPHTPTIVDPLMAPADPYNVIDAIVREVSA